jgi:PPOX class probable F420-dependent enzyme
MTQSDQNARLLEEARALASRESGLAVVVTIRPDNTAQASVVNAGIVAHPLTGEPAVAFVVQGANRQKLANMRARPFVAVVFRSGWNWVTVEGTAELLGPDDPLVGVAPDATAAVFHDIYAAAIGGAPDDWRTRDDVIKQERHTAVLLRPTRIYANTSSG